MRNKKFVGMITGISAGNKVCKTEEGDKIKIPICKVKLETADFDYDDIKSLNHYIASTLLNVQPIPFETVMFGEQDGKFEFDFANEEKQQIYDKVIIKSILVRSKQNIPVLSFMLEIPDSNQVKWLFDNLKSKITFEMLESNQENF